MAIKGAIIGDIVGSQFEFEDVNGLDWENCELFSEKCDFTDDTVMTLAIKSAIDKGVDFQTEIRSIGRKYPLCGYGGRFLEWMFCDDPKPYGSYGNGSAMRVSYIGDYYDDLQEAVAAAKKSAVVSHDHPEGIKGAVTIVTCIWMAKHKKTKEEIYQYVLEQYPPKDYKFSGKSIEDLKECYVEDISCMSGVPAAARCFYESDSYISFLRNTFRFDNDTDTFGAMFGGVAEEYYGKTGLKDDKILRHYLDSYLLQILYGSDDSKGIRSFNENTGEKAYRLRYEDKWLCVQRNCGEYYAKTFDDPEVPEVRMRFTYELASKLKNCISFVDDEKKIGLR